MRFEWDKKKNKINFIKHKISFETAMSVFKDKNRLEIYDALHSEIEDRYMTIGVINNVVYLVTVIYTERGEVIRLISARKATLEERKKYYDYKKRN